MQDRRSYQSSPSVVNGSVLVGGGDGNLYSIPSIHNGVVTVGGRDGFLYALSLREGLVQLWVRRNGPEDLSEVLSVAEYGLRER